MRTFADRREAGRRLAGRLGEVDLSHPIVLGLPRGGVPVAYEVAKALGAPLDVIVVRKLGVPFQPELAMGAVGEDGVRVINRRILRMSEVTERELEQAERRELAEVEARARRFRGVRPRIPLDGREVVIVDDGIATGSTAKAALQVARAHGAGRVVLAVPVAPSHSLAELAPEADDVVCLEVPEPFFAVGQFYQNFSQTSDDEVVSLLAEASDTAQPSHLVRDEDVEVRLGRVTLFGHVVVPERARGLVLFAHGSGSSRHSPRNRFVAQVLNEAGLATLLFDLLTAREAVSREQVFDVAQLADRLTAVASWAAGPGGLEGLPVGYFGASTGAAAALRSAADPMSSVRAVVSRGGRPDLAMSHLGSVRCPTLLIVGSRDELVLELNRQAAAHLRCDHEVDVVPGASHLFEEPGTLEAAATAARDWFLRYLGDPWEEGPIVPT